jgi:chaperone LolA
MRLKIRMFTLLLLCIMQATAQSQAFNPTHFLTQYWDRIETFSAHTTQQLLTQSGDIMQETEGHLILKKNLGLKWTTETDDDIDALVLHDQITLYQKDLNQVIVQNRSELPQNTPLHCLSSNANDLLKSYTVKGSQQGSSTHIRLHPKQGQDQPPIDLVFHHQHLQTLKQANAMGNMLILRFSKTQLNQNLPQKAFALSLPKDATRIDNTAKQ